MNIISTPIKDLYVLEPRVFEDTRGYFFESYNKEKLKLEDIEYDFVQDNQSKSSYGVIRGLHYQLNPKAQTKLVRVLQGKILDVAVDVRRNSPTYGQHFAIELTEDNKKQLLIPRGFAHGFSVLSETAVVMYKCDNYYAPDCDAGIIYNDPKLGIDWQIPADKVILSDKDAALPTLELSKNNFQL